MRKDRGCRVGRSNGILNSRGGLFETNRGDEFVLVSLVFGVALVVGVLTSVVGGVDGVGLCQN